LLPRSPWVKLIATLKSRCGGDLSVISRHNRSFSTLRDRRLVTVYFGEHAAQWIDENTPKAPRRLRYWRQNGSAIGFMMLLKIMWSKEVAGVFFVGLVMTTYLKLPLWR
nr:PTS sugar transporter subunit IIC [Providencia rettgeri]